MNIRANKRAIAKWMKLVIVFLYAFFSLFSSSLLKEYIGIGVKKRMADDKKMQMMRTIKCAFSQSAFSLLLDWLLRLSYLRIYYTTLLTFLQGRW
jgi:hypothetical protein